MTALTTQPLGDRLRLDAYAEHLRGQKFRGVDAFVTWYKTQHCAFPKVFPDVRREMEWARCFVEWYERAGLLRGVS